MRFDEVELDAVPLVIEQESAVSSNEVSRSRRLLAFLTDVSLFVALVLALLPFLPEPPRPVHHAALAGFAIIFSYYYFVGSWILWGKTIGGAIFDVRVVAAGAGPISLRDASMRWAGLFVSFATAGIGFALAALPSRLSLADRMSNTRCG